MKFCPTRICHDACPTRQSWEATLCNTQVSPHPQPHQNHSENPRTNTVATRSIRRPQKESSLAPPKADPPLTHRHPLKRVLGVPEKEPWTPQARLWPHRGSGRRMTGASRQLCAGRTLKHHESFLANPKSALGPTEGPAGTRSTQSATPVPAGPINALSPSSGKPKPVTGPTKSRKVTRAHQSRVMAPPKARKASGKTMPGPWRSQGPQLRPRLRRTRPCGPIGTGLPQNQP